ncbi:YqzL family protein [Pradoshia sp.]
MIEFTWNVFRHTGSVDTYLLLKELERQSDVNQPIVEEEMEELNIPII